EFLSPGEFRRRVADAELVISHAGMGTILTALECETPILVMPRLASQGEQRNDHQVDTANRLREVAGIPVAADERELASRLSRLDEISLGALRGEGSRDALIAAIARFVRLP
ncbi:MAG: glycosyl transferase family 28, partial [Acidimicrobiia bacterium]|nr:glycosyl transferase family 28 [Acidimicrobiia bacterium]